MIPEFIAMGYLPAGVHAATLEEVAARFGVGSELRRVQMESVREMVALARRAGVRRIVLNGSFGTNIMEPNDVDCVLLMGSDYPLDDSADMELEAGLPFLQIEVVGGNDFRDLVDDLFATDRLGRSKGVVEVIL